MSTRWLAGVLLFVLGFASALLVKLPTAGAAAQQGVVEGGFKYIDGPDLQLLYPPGGKNGYLIVVSPKAAKAKDSGPQVSSKSGSAVYSKKDVQRLTVYRLMPLVFWEGRFGRCGNGPFYCPLPPPPQPLNPQYEFFTSGPVSPGRPR